MLSLSFLREELTSLAESLCTWWAHTKKQTVTEIVSTKLKPSPGSTSPA